MAVSGSLEVSLHNVIVFAKELLMPGMVLAFAGGIVLRALIYYTVKREEWFAKEFEKRVAKLLDSSEAPQGAVSFFPLVKRLLEKTYYELFEVRAIMRRRKLDYILAPGDRLFLIQHGSAWLVRDTIKEIRYLKRDRDPELMQIAKNVLKNNPCFSKVFGVIPASAFNDFLNILPGLFVVGGIFGTFLGIMSALPELGNMDIKDPDATKQVMDIFLAKVAFSMSTSVMGILLSVLSTVMNAFVSPERLFTSVVDRYQNCLYRLWNRSDDNRIPEKTENFDEHKDPIDALAELAVEKELFGEQAAPMPPPPRPLPEKKAS